MNENSIPSPVLALAGLAVEYCRTADNAAAAEPRDFCAAMLRYLPRIYITAFDLNPYGSGSEGEDNGAIGDYLEEPQYDAVRQAIAANLGEYEMYLDTPAEDMQFSDTPVAVSLAEQLADIYHDLYDFATTVREAAPETFSEVLADLKYRFDNYLSATVCSAMRATDAVYRNLEP